MFQAFSVLFTIAALFSWVNYKFLKLPNTIGLLLLSLLLAIPLLVLGQFFPQLLEVITKSLLELDFEALLLDVMLSFLLFAGALQVKVSLLLKQKRDVLLLATLGTLLTTFIVGIATFYIAPMLDIEIPFVHALIFGALIAPTDPIAVMAILKKSNVSEKLSIKIEGESLFNDGLGVVIFTGTLLFATEGENLEGIELVKEIGILFLQEVVGGLALGTLIGLFGFYCIKSLEKNTHLAVILTLAVVFGGYALASMFHLSAPLAMVMAGLMLSSKIHVLEECTALQKGLSEFWSIIDEILNAALFVLMGFAIHLLTFKSMYSVLGIIAIILVLAARGISISALFSFIGPSDKSKLNTIALLSWGGLRGGISIALALSLTENISKEIILFITYSVVIFSVLVQGLTIGKLANWLKI